MLLRRNCTTEGNFENRGGAAIPEHRGGARQPAGITGFTGLILLIKDYLNYGGNNNDDEEGPARR